MSEPSFCGRTLRTSQILLEKLAATAQFVAIMALNVRQIKFVRAYCETGNATRSAIAAGYSEENASASGHELLSNPEVAKAINERHQTLAEVAELDEAWVLKRWREIAGADPSELTSVKQVNCRYCYGLNGKYQWTENEYFEQCEKAIKRKEDPPDCFGGFGYDRTRDPNPECLECRGVGETEIHIADTRKISDRARKLFAGVKQTRNGIEVQMRDQDAALANISRYLGMSVERQEISGPNKGPLSTVRLDANDLTDEQLAAILGEGNGSLQPSAGQP